MINDVIDFPFLWLVFKSRELVDLSAGKAAVIVWMVYTEEGWDGFRVDAVVVGGQVGMCCCCGGVVCGKAR